MGILSNLFKQKPAGTKFEPRKPRYQTAAPSQQEIEEAPAEDVAAVEIEASQAPGPAEQPLKSISFGGSKTSSAAAPASAKKNIVSTPESSATKSIRKVSANRENAIPDKQIAVDANDVIPQIPEQYLKAGKRESGKRDIRFSAYELLHSLASGKASVLLPRIAELAPELFVEPLPADRIEISLPLQTIVLQIGAFPCRPDQMEMQYPQLDAHYANLIVGKAGAEADIVSQPAAPIAETPEPEIPAEASVPVAEKIEEVAAAAEMASEPSVETAVPVSAMETTYVPVDEVEEEPAAVLPEIPLIEDKVSYSLAALLPNMPKSWLAGNANPIRDGARVTVPFHLIEAQLATGRVELGFDHFSQGLPEDFKGHFSGETEEGKTARIQIPLNEVFRNLPGVEPLPPSPKPAVSETQEEEVEHPEEIVEATQETAVVEEQPAAESTAPEVEKTEPVIEEVKMVEAPAIVEKIAEQEHLQGAIPAKTTVVEQQGHEVKIEAPQQEIPALEPAPAAATETIAPAETPEQAASPTTETPEIPIPSFRDPEAPSHQIAATITPPKVQLQRVVPPTVFTKDTVAARTEEPAPELEPGKILAFEGVSLAFNPHAVEMLFMTDGKLDARKVVGHISHFPGAEGVVLTIDNETNTAGEIPGSFNAGSVAHAASIMFQSLESASTQPGKVPTRDVTLRHDAVCSTWFKQQHILLGILHTQRSLEEALHNKLVLVTEELAQLR